MRYLESFADFDSPNANLSTHLNPMAKYQKLEIALDLLQNRFQISDHNSLRETTELGQASQNLIEVIERLFAFFEQYPADSFTQIAQDGEFNPMLFPLNEEMDEILDDLINELRYAGYQAEAAELEAL